MIVVLVAAILIAVASISYGVYRAGECDALHLELAVMRRHAENWADAYCDVLRNEDSDGSDS